MVGNWFGYYKYNRPDVEKAIGFERTYFTISITSFDGKNFSGIVNDDVNTGGMKETGKIEGYITGNKIFFRKNMPRESLIVDHQGTRKTSDRKHPTLYYSGKLVDDKKQVDGHWKFKFNIATLLRFWPTSGTFSMRVISNIKLSKEQFLGTMSNPMKDVTQTAAPVLDIWPFVSTLVDAGIVHKHVLKEHLVETVYRGNDEKFDHVLLPTPTQNSFIVIVVDIAQKQIAGYLTLDLNKEYGL